MTVILLTYISLNCYRCRLSSRKSGVDTCLNDRGVDLAVDTLSLHLCHALLWQTIARVLIMNQSMNKPLTMDTALRIKMAFMKDKRYIIRNQHISLNMNTEQTWILCLWMIVNCVPWWTSQGLMIVIENVYPIPCYKLKLTNTMILLDSIRTVHSNNT